MTAKKPALADREVLKKIYPPGIDWDVYIPRINLLKVLEESVAKYGDRPFINFVGKKFTYRQFDEEVNRAAKGLQEIGITPGTKVGMCMPNTSYYPIMFFAALKIGATVVGFNPLSPKEELRKHLKSNNTQVMVTLDLKDFHDKVLELKLDGTLKKVIRCDLSDIIAPAKGAVIDTLSALFLERGLPGRGPTRTDTTKNLHAADRKDRYFTIRYKDIVKNDGKYEPVQVDPDSTAALVMTGGSTGVPKGAMLSHFNFVANATQIEEFFAENAHKPEDAVVIRKGQERYLSALPYFHIFALMVGMISPMKLGAELHIVSNPRDLNNLLKVIEKEKITMFPAVPKLLLAIAEKPDIGWYDLSSLKIVISGGSALTPGTLRAFEESIGRTGIVRQGYGCSEFSPVGSSNLVYGESDIFSVGLPLPGTTIKIVDEKDNDRIVNIGEIGEIFMKGPQGMEKGYFGKPGETAKTVTKDGWVHPGDLGYMDEKYNIYIVDRAGRKALINGNNVYPSIGEAAISEHPAVAECAIATLPDQRTGNVLKAFIRLKDGMEGAINAEQMREFLKLRISSIEVPKQIAFVTEELPKTAVGKPDWKKLQDEEIEKLKAQETKPAAPRPN